VTVNKELNKNIEELINLFNVLKKSKVTYYELFKIKNNAPFNDIKKVYFEFAKKFHHVRVAEAPDPDIKNKANYVFGTINKAYETLSNIDKRKEYDMQLLKGVDENGDTENLIEKAKILYRKAITLNKQAKFWEATNFLEEAVRLDNTKASYFLLLATCQMNIVSLRRAAQKNFEKSLELDPWNADSMIRMGMLFELEQLPQRAEGFFRKALSIDPDNPVARKKLEAYDKKAKKASKFSFFGKKK
jgi:curved DNA-binding protein CbpA